MKKLLGMLVVSSFALFVTPQLHANGGNGWDHGYWWSMWCGSGTVSMSFPYAGSYAGNWLCTWRNMGDGGGGKGWNPGADNRSVGYNSANTTANFKTFGAYGWAPYPGYEMYISDRCANKGGTTYKGSLNSNGGTYNVYTGHQSGASGGGPQYCSNRTSDTSPSGNYTITSQNHFNFWNSHGMGHGSWGEWKLNVEEWSRPNGSTGATVW